MAEYNPYAVARFWSKVRVGRRKQCWLWVGARDRYGYGQFKVKSAHPERAHRIAYKMLTGIYLADDIQLLHECDTPACCNPRHLKIGNHAINMADKAKRGRSPRDARGRFVALARISDT